MSMPSSSELVATRAGSRPAFSSSSIASRCSRATLPWWARTRSSPAASLRRWASRSASRRLLVKTIVLVWSRMSSRISRIDGRPDARPGFRGARRTAGSLVERDDLADGRHVLDRDDDPELERLACPGVDDRDLAVGPAAAEEAGDRLERSLGGREADPLRRSSALGPEVLEALEAQRQVGPALRPGDRVDLVDDDVLDAAKDLPGLAREQEVEALRGRDEDVRWAADEMSGDPRSACRRSGSRW